ncbi:MAG: hypothetical protein SGJ27_29930 [Candidatus Melainabacteria bacterium]|nr:hypothetical protein [Candidatus Melainabacteria bacterium]
MALSKNNGRGEFCPDAAGGAVFDSILGPKGAIVLGAASGPVGVLVGLQNAFVTRWNRATIDSTTSYNLR